MSEPILRVDDLVVEYASDGYAVRPLDGFSMQAEAGQLVGLLGPSGSGKTTLLSVLSGMVPATSGSVTVQGIDVLGLSGQELQDYRRSRIGIVFQGFNLIPSLTARENVAAPLLVAGQTRSAALARADQLLDEVGMDDRANHRPSKLSGGQQQRVAVARGLVADPPLLLADEPTANLDLISAESVVSLLRRLRESGRTIIISTHDNRLLPVIDQIVEMTPVADDAEVETGQRERTLEPGEVLFRQGDASDYIYEIEEGSIDVVRELVDGTEEHLATLVAGNYVGELGPLLGFPRSATVRAADRAKLLAVTVQEFKLEGLNRATDHARP
ncbi:MAG: ATP-binding cassette domain-containing protein [Acidimicrobiales bacterium]|nr:ATP-binding cassette domain-containing protein [Acidimicrobiales bacterium]RZV46342.1 MAG: ATP-binding cassette domain-containing protein [Acidimicrobiales bacterium]